VPDDSSRNPDAFVQLMTEHQGRLYAYVLSLLGDPDQANDVLQEANLVLWRNAGEFQMGSNFRAWAFRIAHFQVMAHRQRQFRDRLVFDDEMLAVLDPAAKAVDETYEERQERLTACLDKLPETQRVLLRQRYADGLSLIHNRFTSRPAHCGVMWQANRRAGRWSSRPRTRN
jgi:RNA polymerase sigma-70 factor (ECF subfamily)